MRPPAAPAPAGPPGPGPESGWNVALRRLLGDPYVFVGDRAEAPRGVGAGRPRRAAARGGRPAWPARAGRGPHRSGPDAEYWTDAVAAGSGPARDFVAAGLRGTGSYTFLTGVYVNGLDLYDDLGLIAVSADEVGVFWSVGACRGSGSGCSGCPASRPPPVNTSVDIL